MNPVCGTDRGAPCGLDTRTLSIVPDPVLHLSPCGTLRYGNPAWCALAASVEADPLDVSRVLPQGVVDHLVKNATAGDCDVHDVDVAGRSFTLRTRTPSPRSGVFVFFRETSEARRLHDCLAQPDRLSQLGQLAADVGHEINNPVAFIRANLGTLDRYVRTLTAHLARLDAPTDRAGLDEIARDAGALIAECLQGIERITKTVADLRSFTRTDGDAQEPVDVHEALDAAIRTVGRDCAAGKKVERAYAGGAYVCGVARQVARLFENLLRNAAQAVGEAGSIAVRTAVVDDTVEISISDDGCGIPPLVQARLFEPFVTTRPFALGTGLGLYVCHNIVRRHGGEIEISSGADGGTTACVRLPLQTKGAE